MDKVEIIRSLIETQVGLMEIFQSQKINQKGQNKIQKVQNDVTNPPVITPEQHHQHSLSKILQDSPEESPEYHLNNNNIKKLIHKYLNTVKRSNK